MYSLIETFIQETAMTHRFKLTTRSHSEFVDITAEVRNVLETSNVSDGVCQVFIPHTTAGVTINENADPDVTADMIGALEKTFPWNGAYRHMEGNSAAHIKASLMGFSAFVPVENGRLVLGTWQGVYFCEFDGPRTRNVLVNVIGG